MITLVFLLEDQSMKELLEGLLPRILPQHPQMEFLLIPHRGKADLDKSIPRKLRAWGEPRPHFVILRDQDSADCVALKQRLLSMCQQEGYPLLEIENTRSPSFAHFVSGLRRLVETLLAPPAQI